MDLKMQLELPLEALVLRHSAAGTGGGSVWAWLAVVAAAFGLWRIRSIAVGFGYGYPRRRRCRPPPTSHDTGKCDLVSDQSPPPPPMPPPPKLLPEAALSAAGEGCRHASFTRKGSLFEAHGCFEEEVDDGESEEEVERPQGHRWALEGSGIVLYGCGGGRREERRMGTWGGTGTRTFRCSTGGW
ncbi:unnamed protein product [Spirodela intermedia]|uniref:Uncharacterized protein n=1 Tax=Spirodela intermedia TaxID=51605 RepID=A0A7I8J3B6_SPIIN|nr:unnamed protein product [Spirodela intermedia]CAA6664608.1 unnamed protein product [Spirodela intermedia]